MSQEQQVIKRKSYKRRPTKNQSIKLSNQRLQIILPMIKQVKEKLRILAENWKSWEKTH